MVTATFEQKVAQLERIADDLFDWAARGDEGCEFYPSNARDYVQQLRTAIKELNEVYLDLMLEWKEDLTRYDD